MSTAEHSSTTPCGPQGYWQRTGAYWQSAYFPNAWDQPAVLCVQLDRAVGGPPDGRLGVAIDSFMCETFLLPEQALAFADEVRRTANRALRAERRRARAGAA